MSNIIHVNKLQIKEVQMDTISSFVQLERTIHSCKICLESNDDDSGNKLINCCNCSGSLKFVHQNCLMEWMNSIKQKAIHCQIIDQNSSIYKIQCEICKDDIKFISKYERIFNNCTQIKEKIKQHQFYFIFYLTLIIISFSAAFYFFVRLIMEITVSNINVINIGIFSGAILFQLLCCLYFIRQFFKIYLMKQLSKITQILQKKIKIQQFVINKNKKQKQIIHKYSSEIVIFSQNNPQQ